MAGDGGGEVLDLVLLTLAACRVEVGAPGATPTAGWTHEVWVYTSMYPEVVDAMDTKVEADLPGISVEWWQAGSEKVAQRWEAEHAAGGSRACVLATSDPLWYVDLTGRGLLRPHLPPRAATLDRAWATPTWSAFRLSRMVLASHGEGPTSFLGLTDPKWKDRFSTPDPLSSGTTFYALSVLEDRLGTAYFASLRANGWVAAGGNAAVLTRMESGERPVGMILEENLRARPNSPVRTITPEEGPIVVPGPAAIPTDCPDPAAAERVMDWLFGEAAEKEVLAAHMMSPFSGVAGGEVGRLAQGAADRRQRLQALLR